MDQLVSESRALELAIARRIRRFRKQNNWTLDELAKVTGLSKGYLSQIENANKVPPIGTLTKIAFFLGIDISSLISGEKSSPQPIKVDFRKASNLMPIVNTDDSTKGVYQSYGFTKQNRIMDVYIVTMSHQYPSEALFHYGQEFVYALEGVHEFYYDGQTYILNPGDSLYFDSDRPHMGRSISKEPAKALVVFCSTSQRE